LLQPAKPELIHDGEVDAAVEVAPLAAAAVEGHCARFVLRQAAGARVVHHAEIRAGLRVAAVARAAVELDPARFVLPDALPILVQDAEVGAPEHVASVAAAPIERRRARIVFEQAAASVVVHPAEAGAVCRAATSASALARAGIVLAARLAGAGRCEVSGTFRG